MRIFALLVLIFCSQALAKGSFFLFQRGLGGVDLNYGRNIYVYLPDGYENSKEEYRVLYMQDGQNLFDPARSAFGSTWEAEKTLNDLIAKKEIPPLIVVGIDNTPDRNNEYIFEKNGDAYMRFMVRNLKPLIDATFRTKKGREHNALMGSSMGGLISLYGAVKYSRAFGLVGALSPSVWWNNHSIYKVLETSPAQPLKVYIDSGTAGGERPEDAEALERIFVGLNVPVRSVIAEGAEHTESAWAKRFPGALKYLFNQSIW